MLMEAFKPSHLSQAILATYPAAVRCRKEDDELAESLR